MKLSRLLYELNARANTLDDPEVLIQLPDNSPPVDFNVSPYDPEYNLILNLFPRPPHGEVWKHDTNIIEYDK